MDGYPTVVPVQVRWSDVDQFGHVNNAVLVSYLEFARVEVWRRWIREGRVDIVPVVVARLSVEYLLPIELAASVEVGLRATSIGRSSFHYEYAVTANGDVAAKAETVMVHVDAKSGQPTPVPDALRACIEDLRVSSD